MGRVRRVDIGGYVYHVINRANARRTIFESDADFAAFERIMYQAQVRTEMRILAWCVMPNHWHMVVWPRRDGDLARHFGWMTLTHTQRWHAHHGTTGEGHLYQGRFKSFLVKAEDYLWAACRYVERNPLRARLVERAEAWRWCSLWHWTHRREELDEVPILSDWPTRSGGRPRNWVRQVNAREAADELDAMRECVKRNRPCGPPEWVERTAERFGLKSVLMPQHRPRKRA